MLYFQFSSVQSLCHVWLCDLINRSMPGLPVHHHLLESTQTHVHWVGDAIQPSHLLSSPSPLTFNLSQHQGLFKWVSSLHQVAKVLAYQSFQWTLRTDIGWTGWISLQSKGLSRVFSSTAVWKHQFFGAQPSSRSNSHTHTWHHRTVMRQGPDSSVKSDTYLWVLLQELRPSPRLKIVTSGWTSKLWTPDC